MPRVLPSQAVAAIDRIFPFLANANAAPQLGLADATALAAIVAVAQQIPQDLVTLDGDNFARLIEEQARIAAFAEHAPTRGPRATFPGQHVRVLRNLIARCPDQAIPASVAALAFVADQQLRDVLRADIASVETSVREADWKAATVMAGSVIEALLLDALLQEAQVDVARATAALVASRTFQRNPPADLDEWALHQYTEVAAQLNVITDVTAAQVRIARGFRNLIHPGLAKRLAQTCDRGTALAATAALEFVVRDLTA
jgi:hypothetical protein